MLNAYSRECTVGGLNSGTDVSGLDKEVAIWLHTVILLLLWSSTSVSLQGLQFIYYTTDKNDCSTFF